MTAPIAARGALWIAPAAPSAPAATTGELERRPFPVGVVSTTPAESRSRRRSRYDLRSLVGSLAGFVAAALDLGGAEPSTIGLGGARVDFSTDLSRGALRFGATVRFPTR